VYGGWSGGGGGGWFGGGAGGRLSGSDLRGLPDQLRIQLLKLLAREPAADVSGIRYSPVESDRRRYNLRRLTRPHLGRVTVALLLVIVETILLQAGPGLTGVGIDKGVVLGNFDVLLKVAGAYVACTLLGAVATGLRTAWTGRLAQELNFDQRTRVFGHLQRLSLDFFTEEKAGRLMSRMTSDIEATNQLIQNGIVQLFAQVLTLVVVTAWLFHLNVRLAVLTELVVVPALFVATFWFSGASHRAYTRVRDAIAALLADLNENLIGFQVVASHNRGLQNLVQHRNLAGEYRDTNIRANRLGAVYGSGSNLIGYVGQAAVLLIGGRMVLSHQLTIGELTAFVLYLTSFFAPIQQLAQLYNTYQQGQAAIAKLADLLAVEPTVRESPTAVDVPPIAGDIRFEQVSFGYDPAELVLEDVDFAIRPGETVSLVGATGAGKSTVAKLLTRFYDPVKGRVLIDGLDLRDVRLESLRRQLGVVPQEPFLFAGSVRDNLVFAKPDATQEEVEDTVRVVGLDELVARLPDGLDTMIEERGSSLSSGERQLVALGRAFLAQPRVLVLDEATSNLDLQSETKVERALDALLEGRTAVIIAHRLSTAMRADRILVISEGRVAEEGSHDELVAAGGLYAAMYRTWSQHTINLAS